MKLNTSQSKNTQSINSEIADDHTIRCEVDGKVYTLLKEPGEMVTSLTPIAMVGDDESFLLELRVDEQRAPDHYPGSGKVPELAEGEGFDCDFNQHKLCSEEDR